MKLTPNFSLAELTITNTGITNKPTLAHRANLVVLALGMEQARNAIGGHPCIITSGYRNPKVNKAVGGVRNSDHALGFACDFKSPALTARQICERIIKAGVVFDQIILERNETLVHLSFNPRLRREVLTQPGGPGSPFYIGL